MRSALIVDGGGRGHAIGHALSEHADAVFFAPGNAGTESIPNANGFNLAHSPFDHDQIVEFIVERNIDLTVIGPEQPLIDGLADKIHDHAVFGPSAEAAQLEGSKAFGVRFMIKNNIPHPKTTFLDNDRLRVETLKGLTDQNVNSYVFKADGPAAGKGVVLPSTAIEAERILQDMFSGKAFDGAGKECVLQQERLNGPELSVFVISDGENYFTLPYAQDHKRLKENDEGPNTGGMGAYAPVPDFLVNQDQVSKINEIVMNTVNGTNDFEKPYRGVIFIGIMLAEEYDGDPVVIEYNVRFGDPEAQVLFSMMQRTNVNTFELLKSAAEGNLRPNLIPKIGGAALTVCLAAEGYPDKPRTGDTIYGLDRDYKDVIIHHGGTAVNEGGRIITAGGRVLYVTGLGETLTDADDAIKPLIGEHGVHFRGMQHRNDIGYQALRLR
jgi:phosphoribosylamine--glycine ligase